MLAAQSAADRLGEVAVTLNGEPRSLEARSSIRDLLAQLQLDGDAVAVERNREIVGRAHWQTTLLRAGDTIEIVHFVGGG